MKSIISKFKNSKESKCVQKWNRKLVNEIFFIFSFVEDQSLSLLVDILCQYYI